MTNCFPLQKSELEEERYPSQRERYADLSDVRKRISYQSDETGTQDLLQDPQAGVEGLQPLTELPADTSCPGQLEDSSAEDEGLYFKAISASELDEDDLPKGVEERPALQNAEPNRVARPVLQKGEPKQVERPVVQKAEPKRVEGPAFENAEPTLVQRPVVQNAEPNRVARPVLQNAEPKLVERPALQNAEPKRVERPALQNTEPSLILKEVDAKDDSVDVASDHRTRCALTFDNALLFELD